MSARVGIDTGGTFTDVVIAVDGEDGLRSTKVLSTPRAPARAILVAFERCAVDPAEIESIVFGTTLSTNSVIERRGARVVYVTTHGFEDNLHIQRIDRQDPYDLRWVKPAPFVRREDTVGIDERIDATGAVVETVTAAKLEALCERVAARLATFRDDEEPAIAVSLLFAYANAEHEVQVQAALEHAFPEVPISVSHRISPIWREYERASTVVLDAYLKPITARLVETLESQLGAAGFGGHLTIMRSDGGHAAAGAIAERPVDSLLSGLSSGMVAARETARRLGLKQVVTLDMGGTSTDVGFIVDGEILQMPSFEVEFGIPVAGAAIDVLTLGAGGGSVAWVDEGGMLHVGPRSAGSEPGPAAYGRGGTQATVTDANLLLGRLDTDGFAGGAIDLDVGAATAALEPIAERLGLTVVGAASAVVRIANENIANAMRRALARRGMDPRACSIMAFGGGGPLHAPDVARALQVRDVRVPRRAGVASAVGALHAEHRVQRRWTQVRLADAIDTDGLHDRLDATEDDVRAQLLRDGFTGESVIERRASIRYVGQNFESELPLPNGAVTAAAIETAVGRFHDEHERAYGYAFRDQTVEFVDFAVIGTGASLALTLAEPSATGGSALVAERMVTITEATPVVAPVFDRASLAPGTRIDGPAFLAEAGTTILIAPGDAATVDTAGYVTIVPGDPEDSGPTGDAEPDAVSLTVIDDQLTSIATEMGNHMMRTAYSPIFSESRDFSCALFSADGSLLAQGPFSPAQLGAVPEVVRYALEDFSPETLAEGDVLLLNDPYRGSCHMPEHTVVKPVFIDGKIVAFVANIAHMAEIGAMVAGSFAANATEVWQEGLRLPTVKLVDRGQSVDDIWRIVLANHRTPRNSWGDLQAMIGSLHFAEARLQEFFATHGIAYALRAFDTLLDHAERTIRARITALPDGRYVHEDVMEDDGIEPGAHRLHVCLTIHGDRLFVDYSGSSPQARGPVNCSFAVGRSAAYNATLQLLGRDVPRNAGAYRPITVVNPAGLVTNARFPGPSVGGNTETQPKLIDIILAAFYRAVPELTVAAEGSTACSFLFGGDHPTDGSYYVHYQFEGCGWGAYRDGDGSNVLEHVHGNCRNTPVEVFDAKYPWRTLSYGLVPDSGGAGARRGGLSSRRVIRCLAPEVTISALGDRALTAAWGVKGGQPGGHAAFAIRRHGTDEFLPMTRAFGTASPSKFAGLIVHEGDEILIQGAGGGGYGDPRNRPVDKVQADVIAGVVSAEAAERDYGVVIDQGGGTVDHDATNALRGACAA